MLRIIQATKSPLTEIGRVAGYCYATTKESAFPRIAKDCIKGGHTRTAEFADITVSIENYSAKFMRELYTHIAGTSRLQESTRYIDYAKQFDEIVPPSVQANEEALKLWVENSAHTFRTMNKLKELGIPREDFSNKLPLSYQSKMVLKINVRALLHMFNLRTCTRAYWEFRNFMKDLRDQLRGLNDPEWDWLLDEAFKTKCEAHKKCPEGKKFACGRYPAE